jgi:hypothetical protein
MDRRVFLIFLDQATSWYQIQGFYPDDFSHRMSTYGISWLSVLGQHYKKS